MGTKTVSLVLFLFIALMLTHAAFIDYRSGAAETQPQFRTTQDKMAGQMLYLQARKMSGAVCGRWNWQTVGRKQTVSIVPKGIQRTAEMMDHVKDERGMLS